MKTLLLLCLFSVFLLGTTSAEEVLTLTTSNFDSHVDSAEFIVVEFYAPWCGHCKSLAPEYEKAAQTLKSRGSPIILAKVDATEHPDLGSRFAVQGYPTIKIFRNGVESEYNGPRQAEGIVSFLEKQAGPASKVLASAADIESFKQRGDLVVISYGSGDSLESHRATANKLRDDFLFGEVSDPELVAASGYAGKTVLVRSDGKVLEITGDDAEKFIRGNSIPVAGEWNQDSSKRYAESGLPTLKVFTAIDWSVNSKRTSYYKRRTQKAGEEFEGKINFALADKKLFDPSAFGYSGTVPEAVVVIEDPTGKKYLSSYDTFSVENLKQFATDYIAGTLKAYLKSEPVPAKQGPVVTVVGSNFDDVVLDPSKNVLIEFYAPWCGHCKSLAPKYDELGKKYEDSKDVVIAKIDATANDYRKDLFEVAGFPTIFFKPAGENASILKYEGAREVSDFKSFIKKNSAKPSKKGHAKDEL